MTDKDIDEFLLGQSYSPNSKSFDKWEAKATDWSWDSILKEGENG